MKNWPAPSRTLMRISGSPMTMPAMAAALGTEAVLVVPPKSGATHRVVPIPVAIEGIPNNHLSYAMQWFMIAAVWAGMTVALIWRIRQRQF